MHIASTRLVYFSPTGTTRKVLEGIANGIGSKNITHTDLTLLKQVTEPIQPGSDELVLIGAPVYGGRLPTDAVSRFGQLQADHTLAVLVVVYGNREFEDALLELKNLAIDLGFTPVAGGAFIGEHSFASRDIPIASGRPDEADIEKAVDFGMRIKEKVTALQSINEKTHLDLPGTFPYEAGGAQSFPVSPITIEGTCTLCGTCAGVCPTEAISIGAQVTTMVERCIRCCACIKNCPEEARVIENETWIQITDWLHEHCSHRKEPELFGVDG